MSRGLRGAVVVAVLFFLSCLLVAVRNNSKFPSPDETANFRIARQVAIVHSLTIPSPLSQVGGIVAPRGFIAGDGVLVPGSFVGMPYAYGMLARVVGTWVIPFLTPLLSAFGLIVAFLILRRILAEHVALLSTILIAVHPAFWYYSARGMFHNAAFFDMVIVGVYALIRALSLEPGRSFFQRYSWYVISGVFLGVAVAFRTSETIWLALVVLVIIVAHRHIRSRIVGILTLLVALLIPLSVIFVLNHRLFGHALSFGYASIAPAIGTPGSSAVSVIQKSIGLLFPFGIHPVLAVQTAWKYIVTLFLIPTTLAGIGIGYWLRSRKNTGMILLCILTLFVGMWLVTYYGSWQIQDNPDPNAVDIGTSYVRYWIPLFVMSMPFAAYALDAITRRYSGVRRHIMLVTLTTIVIFASSIVVLADQSEGLAAVRSGTLEYQYLASRAVAETPANAVILAGHADKIFFPERSVIVSVDTPEQQQQLRVLMRTVPVYLYVSASEAPSTARQVWEQRGFALGDEISLASYERLYRLTDAGY